MCRREGDHEIQRGREKEIEKGGGGGERGGGGRERGGRAGGREGEVGRE